MMIALRHSARIPLGSTLALLMLPFLFGCSDSSDLPADAASRTWTVRGSVSYVGAPTPLPGITIQSEGVTATSGPDGSYELKGITAGSHTISATAPNCRRYSASIEVRGDTRHYIFLERIGAKLTGYVSNMLDGPIAGATITIGGLTDLTDAAGKFAVSEVPMRPDSLIVTHPRYFSGKATFLAEGPEAHFDVMLKRDSVFPGTIVADSYVDESRPTQVAFGTILYLSGGVTGSVRRHIYIDFEFPAFMRDPNVTLIDGSLELCGEAGQQSVLYRAYALNSQWQWYLLNYNQQPMLGRQIANGTIGTSSDLRYWLILNSAAIGELLADYRRSGLIYGIAIQCGTANYTRSFYSSRSDVNRPRVSYKVRF
jgi:hypothetical protein